MEAQTPSAFLPEAEPPEIAGKMIDELPRHREQKRVVAVLKYLVDGWHNHRCAQQEGYAFQG